MSATYLSLANGRLDRLWRALYAQAPSSEARARLDSVLLPWAHRTIPRKPAWPSDIGDDQSPFEFSVATERGGPHLRFLVEVQGEQPTLASTREAALAATYRLGEMGVDLKRFEVVRDLFLPDVPNARFALWHALQLSHDLEVKAYFNPQIHGNARAHDLVETALGRLGFADVWPSILAATQRRTDDDEIRYFALDLSADERARVKVYFYQRGVSVDHLERMASICPEYVPGEVTEFCRTLTGTSGPYVKYPMCTYLSIVEGQSIPSEVTMQIPVRFYVENDAVARDRVIAYLTSRGLSSALFESSLEAIRTRPLEAGSGLTAYVSLRTRSDRLTYYLSVEAFGITAQHARGERVAMSMLDASSGSR